MLLDATRSLPLMPWDRLVGVFAQGFIDKLKVFADVLEGV
jgi:hypothetical protein